jgi:hypothetical protein
MIEELLSDEENLVYELNRFKRMNKEQISKKLSKQGRDFSTEKVQKILNEIDRKAYINARYEKLSNFTYTYCRVFRVAREYLKEKEQGIKHVFNIDYSDLYVYINPVMAIDTTLHKGLSSNNLGSIHYMLNSKHENKYCFLPPSVWELINRTYATIRLTGNKAVPESFFDTSYKNSRMSAFYDLLSKWNGNNSDTFNKELINRYQAVGDWLEILALANEKKLDERLAHNYSNIEKMFKGADRVLWTIDDKELGINLSNVNLDKKTYETALEKLKLRRPTNRSVNNKIDAASVAMTYDLTKDTENKTYYRFISHSKHVSEAFNSIRLNPKEFSDEQLREWERDEVDIACCPQLVSTLSLIENNQISGIDKNDLRQIDTHLENCITNISKIHQQLDKLKYVRDDCYLERELSRLGDDVELAIAHISTPLQEYLNESNKFTATIYPSIIEHIMDINAGKKKAEINYDTVFAEDKAKLEEIFASQERYKDLMQTVFDSIYNDAQNTLAYCEENLLTDDIRAVTKKLVEQMDTGS